MKPTLDCLIPAPESICYVAGTFDCKKLVSVFYKDEPSLLIDRLVSEAAYFGVNLSVCKDNPSIRLELDNKLDREAYRMTITPEDITISSGAEDGLRYGLSALIQLIAIALIEGPTNAFIPCGEINDKPRFTWRGFLLDSSRHFQDVNCVLKILNIMSHLRLNVLHLHLTDSQGWRIQTETLKGLELDYTNTPGFYTKGDIKKIVQFAKDLGIKIVPEIDIPGHSKLLLKNYPQFACNPENPGTEICLANLEARETLKKLLLEVFEMFPYSDLIHLGGDEAATTHWDNCPKCQAYIKEHNLGTSRNLEHEFMMEMTRFVVDNDRFPIVWGICSDLTYPEDTIIQSWLDIREPIKIAENGNRVIYSVHSSLYFDYPMDLSEPHDTWMFPLSQEGVYLCDPYIIWPDKVKNSIVGVEGALWTEIVPQHRVIPKIMPRITALSETAWTKVEHKDFYKFLARDKKLIAAGYQEFLREGI